jgi:hypothetical protein
VVFALMGLLLLAQGVVNLWQGRHSYENYWGGKVFAPFAIVLGTMTLVVVVFGWDLLPRRRTGSGPRPSRRQPRRRSGKSHPR